jgi:restriction endonuclease S subunit
MLSEVPFDWRKARIDEVLQRNTTSISVAELAAEGLVAHYSLPAFDANKKPVIESGAEIKSNKTAIDRDCLLFSKLNPRIPRVWRVQHSGVQKPVCSTEFWALTPKTDEVSLSYAEYFLGWSGFLSQPSIKPASSTNSHQRVDRKAFDAFMLPVPPLNEQQRIAEVLSSVDASIQATQAVIDQAERVQRGLMEELLTSGLGSAAIERGEVPEGWEVKALSDVAVVKGGKRMPKGAKFSEEPTSYPYIRVSDFANGSISTKDIQYVSPEHQAQIARYTISKEDVYISIAGTLGVVGTVPDELDGAQLTENAAKISILSAAMIDREFLARVLQSSVGQSQIGIKKGVGGGVPKLALLRIGEIKLPIPPLQEQKRIAEVLSSIDEFIAAQKSIIEQQNRIKHGLMDDLLTGKVRTV